MLRTSELFYELPPELIATSPAAPRDAARLMVVAGDQVRHQAVSDLPRHLRSGDCLVLNTTRVLPARFRGRRIATGGKVEGLYLSSSGDLWTVLLRGGHLRVGGEIDILDHSGRSSGVVARIESRQDPGAWRVRIRGDERAAAAILKDFGETPLPPYIVKARQAAHVQADDRQDRERYQTVYAATHAGSVAAPTAGLHFTPTLLDTLRGMGVEFIHVVLHVGAGTFKPVETAFVEDHPMHAEWCSMDAPAIAAVKRARAEGRRVIAVGTTAARTLEAYAADPGPPPPSLETRLLITPGYPFRWVDGLLTNFHLPGSTLMALVGAFLEAHGQGGVQKLQGLYRLGIDERYRFYSFGDAMLILD